MLTVGQKLFVPSRHLWLRAIPSSSTTSMKNSLRIDVGMTDRGIEDIGDIQCYQYQYKNLKDSSGSSSSLPLLHSGRDDILIIKWNAHLITEADELYHTVWETISKTTPIASPLDGYLEEMNDSLMTKKKIGRVHVVPALDSDTTLFTIRTNEEMIQSSLDVGMNLCCEDEYEEIVASSERGMFYDEDVA